MAANHASNTNNTKRIVMRKNDPYLVYGNTPLVRKTQIVSEHGEPLTWKKEETLNTNEMYRLCRCGQSSNKPFCDDTHEEIGFNGTETADTGVALARQVIYKGGTRIVVKRDYSLCMEAGFCANRMTSVQKMVLATDDIQVRAQVIAMVERCPSGSYTYAIAAGEADIEPDFPQQVAVTTEITAAGPIAGPLWVTGNIPIERADGQPFETRNRVTLCRCGLSKRKLLCDGAHRTLGPLPG